MLKTGPIIIIEDDKDDQDLIGEAFQELEIPNRIDFYSNCQKALDYLLTTKEQPFLILSDVNLPGMNGTELRRIINQTEYLRIKSIPFVFFTTTATRGAVMEAYQLMVQGYFQKPMSTGEIKRNLKLIIDYWQNCLHPNSDF